MVGGSAARTARPWERITLDGGDWGGGGGGGRCELLGERGVCAGMAAIDTGIVAGCPCFLDWTASVRRKEKDFLARC
jgi:hypothetical protein